MLAFVNQLVSHIIFSMFLILIAWGWTIKDDKLDEDHQEIIIPIGVFVGVLHIFMGMLSFIA
jgi:glycerol uptake facilitator-like aquaporin